jgi:cell wall integrity and stress response component
MKARFLLVSAFLAAANVAMATTSTAQGVEMPTAIPKLGTDTVHGCFSSKEGLTLQSVIEFNSQGQCAGNCRTLGKTVGATQASSCYCGMTYPPNSSLVANDKCDEPCPGYGTQACGGLDTYTVYNTGVLVEVAYEPDPSSSSSAVASSTSTASSTTQSVMTVGSTLSVRPCDDW